MSDVAVDMLKKYPNFIDYYYYKAVILCDLGLYEDGLQALENGVRLLN